MELRLPELGEGIVDATVVNVPVKAGQPVKTGDTVIEVETDKASMPIPATADGTISEVRVKAGGQDQGRGAHRHRRRESCFRSAGRQTCRAAADSSCRCC